MVFYLYQFTYIGTLRMSIMIYVPKFGHRLASAQAKDERLDWIISQLKKNKRFDLKKLSEFERLEVEEFIQ